MINIKDFDSSLLKIGKKVIQKYWNFITIKDSNHVEINSVNPLYIIINEVDGSISETNGNKYITFASTDKKKTLEKHTKPWDEIKYHIQTINADKFGKY